MFRNASCNGITSLIFGSLLLLKYCSLGKRRSMAQVTRDIGQTISNKAFWVELYPEHRICNNCLQCVSEGKILCCAWSWVLYPELVTKQMNWCCASRAPLGLTQGKKYMIQIFMFRAGSLTAWGERGDGSQFHSWESCNDHFESEPHQPHQSPNSSIWEPLCPPAKGPFVCPTLNMRTYPNLNHTVTGNK